MYLIRTPKVTPIYFGFKGNKKAKSNAATKLQGDLLAAASHQWIGGFVEGVIYGEAKEFLQVAQSLGVQPSKFREEMRWISYTWSRYPFVWFFLKKHVVYTKNAWHPEVLNPHPTSQNFAFFFKNYWNSMVDLVDLDPNGSGVDLDSVSCQNGNEVGKFGQFLSIFRVSKKFFNLKQHTSKVSVFHRKKVAKPGVFPNLRLDVWTGGIRTCVPGASAWQNGLLWSGAVWWINPGETSRRNFTTAAYRRKGRVRVHDQQTELWLVGRRYHDSYCMCSIVIWSW